MKPKWKREAQKARRRETYGTMVIRSQPPSTHAERRQGRRVWRQISRDYRVYCRPNRKRRRTLEKLSRELVASWRGWRSTMREYPAGPPPFAVEGVPEGLKDTPEGFRRLSVPVFVQPATEGAPQVEVGSVDISLDDTCLRCGFTERAHGMFKGGPAKLTVTIGGETDVKVACDSFQRVLESDDGRLDGTVRKPTSGEGV